MAKKTPVGLQAGDRYETPWGELEIKHRNGDLVTVEDIRTDEIAELHYDDLISVMQANIMK